ncbi:DUF4129 domain-containing transglutaminase family protein [Lysinibacillus sp. NPDC097287]|uniref:DUF4129 domain-containing transglutaminase family protein n=1 Tax=Lysinibacillus sp. NPDC097287 TaxID=3364144 RepID=UPI0038254ED4
MKKSFKDFIELTIAYIIIFFILREWLVPVMELTNTGLLHLFLVFIGLSLALSLFEVHPLLSGIVKLGYIAWFVVFAYSGNSVFSQETIPFLFGELKWNITAIFSGDFGGVSNTFRTVLFLALIWMLVYLIHHWITVRMNIFYFFALTVFFIATLDTFSEYDGSAAIVKVVVLGLVMTGVLFVKRLLMKSDASHNLLANWQMLVPMVVMVVMVSIVALFLPKIGPTWADPVPFIKSVTGQGESGEGKKTVGYGEDDSQLGGPFNGDDTLVFTASSRDRHYWRIETKDFYTSKGWIQYNVQVSSVDSYFDNEFIQTTLQVGQPENESQIDMNIAIPMPFLIQTYGMKSVESNEETMYVKSNQTEKILTKQPTGEDKALKNYTLTYSEPEYSMQQLRMSDPSMLETLNSSYNRFLQLPSSLPQRVQDLAIELTEGKETVYEKIKAIESYFSRSGFAYDKKAATIPGEGQDFVDQFLFDTKIGYCDHFSTSMIVMLRSIGIPARWVKGFAPGNAGSQSDGISEYRVTNDNAHSWVEAYVPGTGWIEFEPTIGFSGTANIDYDLEIDTNSLEEPEQPAEQPKPQKESSEAKKDTSGSVFNIKAITTWLKGHTYVWVAFILLVVIALITLFVQRKTWIPKMHVRSYRKKEADWSTFDSSYHVLTKQLSRIGLRRRDGETLRAFAERVDAALETEEMKKLTSVYEQHIYSNQPQDIDFVELKESWEYLINRTIG